MNTEPQIEHLKDAATLPAVQVEPVTDEDVMVARLTAANGWRPIESAPNTSDVVLFFCRESRTRQSVHITRADDYYNGAHWRKEATHWMPLPEPPKENSNG